jgi:branched-chain amino acid transport system permease protein
LLASDLGLYYVTLAVLVAAYWLLDRIVGSRFGRVLGAIRQNPMRVRAVGIDPFRYQLLASVLSGSLCAVAGVLLANQSEFVSPAFMTWQRSGELLVMVVLGGMGRLWGAILGAIGLLTLEEFLPGLTENWKMLLGPLLILAALGRGGRLKRLVKGAGR